MREIQPKARPARQEDLAAVRRSPVVAKPIKSRNGCQRCKARRQKCDELQPACKRCIDKGVDCPGYTKDLRWSTKYEVLQPNSKSAMAKKVRRAGQATQPRVDPPSRQLEESGFIVSAAPTIACDPELDSQVRGTSTLANHKVTGAHGPQSPPQSVTVEHDGDHLLESINEHRHHAEPYLFAMDNEAFKVNDFDYLATNPSMNFPFDPSESEDADLESVDEFIQRFDSSPGAGPISRRARSVSINSAHDPGNLLKWFYRMSPSQYSDTDLVEHYFSNVCRLYALFDSAKNPFRALVGSNWDSSGSISLAIQSMACAHLANTTPAMVQIGREKQRQARLSIHNDLQLWKTGTITADRVLLATLLLGPTVSWHNAGDIGLDYLNIAREIVNAKLSRPRSAANDSNRQLEQFFLQAMIYWEMMVAFVDSRDNHLPVDPDAMEAGLKHLSVGTGAESRGELIKPHPWTGIAPHVTILFAEVGRIIRRRVSGGPLVTQAEERWASAVEKALVTASIPARENVIDYEDGNTPEDHFVQLAEAYRCAGLLHIYHLFPLILSRRLAALDAGSSVLEDHTNTLSSYRITLALQTLDIVGKLPLDSGTSCLHPILVLTAGSELRYVDLSSSTDFIVRPSHQRIVNARAFADQRLMDLAKRLPEKPFLRMLEIMRETWLRSDMFDMDVHWMEVMYEKGWETIMG